MQSILNDCFVVHKQSDDAVKKPQKNKKSEEKKTSYDPNPLRHQSKIVNNILRIGLISVSSVK